MLNWDEEPAAMPVASPAPVMTPTASVESNLLPNRPMPLPTASASAPSANINPEDALEKTNRKFIARFNYLESEVNKSGKSLSDMTLDEMDFYWNEAKKLPH
jgi:hypothetical protein